ncbi:MAG: response regulator transcription factor [Leptolinea sp.]|jgi:DNA-binding CsgD family transcriptional regulator|nr:response regulator transcription factor [Leptolinea sp.]
MTHLIVIHLDQTFSYHILQLPVGQVLLDIQAANGLPDYIKSESSLCKSDVMYATFCWKDWIIALPDVTAKSTIFQSAGGSRLTRRQLDVLNFLSQGKTGKQIAGRLNISQRSVSLHISALKRNLNANTAAECVQKAARLGILKPGG